MNVAGTQPHVVDAMRNVGRSVVRAVLLPAVSRVEKTITMPPASRIEIVEAITASDLEIARRMVASGYARLALPPVAVEDTYRQLFADESSATCSPLVTTYLIRCDGVAVGTASLRRCQAGAPGGYEWQFESMRLMHADRPWCKALGYRPEEIGEITRLALSREGQAGLALVEKAAVMRRLCEAILDNPMTAEVRAFVAIMPHSVSRLIDLAGLAFRRVEGTTLAADRAENATLFRSYPRYWLPDNPRQCPRLYLLKVRPPNRGVVAAAASLLTAPLGY